MKGKLLPALLTLILGFLSMNLHGQCNTPTNVRLVAYGPDFITIDWDNTTAGTFQYRYVIQGGSLVTATINTTSNKPLTISGLSANTNYVVQVKEQCSPGPNPWPAFLSARTSCTVVNPPFTANFNGAAWTVGALNAAGSINACWQRNAITGYIWKPGPPQFVSTLTGASSDKSGNGKYVQIDQISFPLNPSDSADFVSPLFDLGTLNSPQMSFWYHMYGANIEKLKVYISTDFGLNYSLLQTISGQQQSSNTDAWKESILNLSAYANDTVRILFRSVEQTVGIQNAICIDDVSIEEAPNCPKPSNLQLVFAGFNSAQLSWTSGGANNWELSYGTPGFSPNSGTIVAQNSNPGTLTGLSPNTNYQVYVRDSCGAGDVSDWFGPISFRTACNPVATPYSENFDANGFVTSSTFNGLGNINSCWQRTPVSIYAWKTGPPLFSPTNTGPSGDHTTGSAQFMYTEVIAGGSSDSTILQSPLIDLNGLNAPELKFYVHMFGANISQLKVYISNGGNFQLLNTQSGQQQNSKTQSWKEVIAPLSAYLNDTIQLRFVGFRSANGFAADISIDDITIDEAPSCPRPQNLAAISVGTTTANLSWTTGGATNWNVSYGAPGNAANAGTIVNASSNPFNLSGLTANTSYDIYVRDSCGPGDVSVWTGPLRIQTECNAIAAPYFENFDGTDFVPGAFNSPGTLNSCWSKDTAVNYQWSVEDGPPGTFNSGPNADHTTGSGQYIFSQAIFTIGVGQVTETAVESPLIDLSALNIPELRFWYHMFGQGIDSLGVEVNDGTGYQHVWSISGQQQTASSDPWAEAIVSLANFANNTISVRIIAYRNSPFSNQAPIGVDDFRIDEQPSCPQPSNLNITAVGSNSITLSWTTGGATNWQIEYGAPGFSAGSGTLVNANSNPFVVNGLTPNTPYQFIVRDSCGVGSVSFWSSFVQGRTACTVSIAPYFEDFDNGLWNDPSVFNDPGNIDPCWSRSDTTTYYWRGNQGAGDGFNTGPDADHTSGNGFYAYTIREGIFNSYFSTDLFTPLVSLDTLSSPELRFWYHMFGQDIDKLVVAVNAGSGWSNVNTISGQQQTAASAAWLEKIISLSSYVGDTIQIRFRAFRSTGTAFRASIAIDDIRIDNTPTCPNPTNIQQTANTQTTITLDWTTGGATNWQIQYRPAGSTGPYNLVSVNSKPFVLNGLNPNTNYEISVRDSCSANDVSWWEGPFIGNTACGISSLPFNENFDNTPWQDGIGFFSTNDQISPCWTRNRQTSNDKWGVGTSTTPSFATGPQEDALGSGNYIYFESDFSTTANPALMTSPEIALVNTSTPKLYYSYHMFGNNINSLKVQINTRNNGNNITLRTWTGQQQFSNGAAWKEDSLDLSAYVGDTIEVVFRAVSSGGQGDIAVDDVSVRSSGPSCGVPYNLQVQNQGYTSLSFSWQNSNTGNSVTTLRWYDAALGIGSATVVPNVSSPYSINNLNPSSQYVVELFDSCTTTISASLIDTLSTLICDSVTANFTYTSRFLRRNFTSGATNADSLKWYFGNGDSSALTNPVYFYSTPGTYTVTLIASNICGNSDTIVQVLEVCDTLRANFNWTQSTDSTHFTADPANNASGYSWDLGNGTSANGNTASAFYSDTLDKFVTLVSWNNCGDTVRNTRRVEACDPPRADWTYTVLSPINSGLRIQFDGTISTGASSYSWDFGDGNTGTGPMPIHIYSTPGLFYKVTLTINGVCGSSTRSFKLNQLGLDASEIPDPNVYPNPVKRYLRIEWPEEAKSPDLLMIYNSTGQPIRNISIEELNKAIDLSDLAPGYYHLVIKGPFGELHYPLIKK